MNSGLDREADSSVVCTCLGDALGWAAVELYREGRTTVSFGCSHYAGTVTTRFRPQLWAQTPGLEFTAIVNSDQGRQELKTFFVPEIELFRASREKTPRGRWELITLARPEIRELPLIN